MGNRRGLRSKYREFYHKVTINNERSIYNTMSNSSNSSCPSPAFRSGIEAASWMSSFLTKPALLHAFRQRRAHVDSTVNRLRTCNKINRPLLKTRSTSTDVAKKNQPVIDSHRF